MNTTLPQGPIEGRITIDVDAIYAFGTDTDVFDCLELELAGLRQSLIEEIKRRLRNHPA